MAESVGRWHPMWKWQAEEEDAATNNKIILTHVAFKGAQTGSLLMTLFQVIAFRGRIKSLPFFKTQVIGTVSTCLGSTAAGYYMIKTSDPIRNYDRAVRIQFNSDQNRCDKYSVVWAGLFTAFGFIAFPVPTWTRQTIWKFAGMTCAGTGFGAFTHYITKRGTGPEMLNLWR